MVEISSVASSPVLQKELRWPQLLLLIVLGIYNFDYRTVGVLRVKLKMSTINLTWPPLELIVEICLL